MAVAAHGLSVDSLKPHDGGLDIAPLKRLDACRGVASTTRSRPPTGRRRRSTAGLVPQLAKPLPTFGSTPADAAPVTAELRKVMPVLYPALGGDGTRHYLLIFQNNAEERSSGGNPAALSMLVVNDGKVTLGTQPNSGDFPHPYPSRWSPSAGTGPASTAPTPPTTRRTSTFTPDFPQTAVR